MATVNSKDGTSIAYQRTGSGPAVILIDGAMCYRGFGPMPELSKLLAPHFTVYTYDRRGRGESGDTRPYSVQREVDDLEALVNAAGGSAFLCGLSSGGALALETAIRLGDQVKKLAIYEAPYNSDENERQEWRDYARRLGELVEAGSRGEAVGLFMSFVGTPAEMVEGMKSSPVWPMFEAVAPTLVYDRDVLGNDRMAPIARAAQVKASALVMNGGAGFPFMRDTAAALARAIPHARHRVLEGQRHDVSSEVLAPVLVEFFNE